MRIVINAFSARVGGGKTYLVNLLRNLPAQPELEIILLAHPDLDVPEDSRIRREHIRWPVRNPILRTAWERLFLPAYLKRVRADVLFCPGGVVATRAPASCRTATMFRNMLPFDKRARRQLGMGLQQVRNRLLRRVMLKSMARADLTIFISDYARQLIETLIRPRNAVTIPHGVNQQFRTFDRAPARPEEIGAGEYILYVSRFEAYKNHVEVVKAFAAIPSEIRGDLRLILAGETNLPPAARVTELIAELGLENSVVMFGGIAYERLPAFYHHAKVNLFASSCENCPNILLEALGAGRPLLSSDVMPMPEFGGKEIAYFSPFDPDSIRHSLERVLTDSGYSQHIAAAAAERSLQYDWQTTASRTWAQLLALKRPSA